MVASFHMSRLIDIESQRQLPIPLQSRAFIGARERLAVIALASSRCTTFHLLLLSLADASNEELLLTRRIFFAWKRGVTRSFIWMAAHFLLLPTWLQAWSLSGILALAHSMACFLAIMHPALQLPAAYASATNVTQPALLILE
jgi:hypothetical protein